MRSKTKKKIILLFVGILMFLFSCISIMIVIDKNNINKLEETLINNTKVKRIEYANKYDNYYIVMDDKYLYLFNNLYEEVTKLDLSLINSNKNNYDIVYRDKTIMYMNDYKNKNKLIFEYYDVYTYELIDKIVVGGN